VQTVPQEAPGSRIKAIAFTPGNRMKAIAFSGDRMFLATAVGDHTVQLWRIEPHGAAHQVTSFADLPGEVWAVALSADQRALASSDDEGTIIVWDAQTGAVLHRLSPDGPYERMNIYGIRGLNTAQRAALKALGAIEEAVA
jgi:WD40 repeat protein